MTNYFIFNKKLLIFLGYIAVVFRGTRQLLLEEGRTIAKILRREYSKLFTDRVEVLGRYSEFSHSIRFFAASPALKILDFCPLTWQFFSFRTASNYLNSYNAQIRNPIFGM
jgi:hypothetical protein